MTGHHYMKLFGTTTVGTKGQVVIPVSARDEMSIDTGDQLYVFGSPQKGVLIMLKESQIEEYIQNIDLHVDALKSLIGTKDDADINASIPQE